MSSSITTYGASYVLNLMFGGRDVTPTSFYLALLTTLPGPQTDGSLISEPAIGDGYARAQIVNDQYAFGGATGGVIASTTTVIYPVATADWPVVVGYALCDSTVGGQVYLYGSFNAPRKVMNGDQARIAPQALSFSVTGLSTATSSTF